jgi:hypothetical protein
MPYYLASLLRPEQSSRRLRAGKVPKLNTIITDRAVTRRHKDELYALCLIGCLSPFHAAAKLPTQTSRRLLIRLALLAKSINYRLMVHDLPHSFRPSAGQSNLIVRRPQQQYAARLREIERTALPLSEMGAIDHRLPVEYVGVVIAHDR